MEEMTRLREITRTLREPGGCDWDRAQNYETMRECLVEEAYEVIDAVNRRDFADLREELGDLLFLVFFYARLAQEEGRFELEDVAREISDKLVRRHPHVFGDAKVENVQEILGNWEAIKRAEKSQGPAGPDDKPESILKKTEDFLPALMRAYKIQNKAARVGFDWSESEGVLDKIQEELDELREAVAQAPAAVRQPANGQAPPDAAVEEEIGDMLFTLVNLSRKREMNAELVLNRATDKFIARFRRMEELAFAAGQDFEKLPPAEKEKYWDRARAESKATPTPNA